ncbi:RNA-binding protein YlmH [Desulfitispora alkaliphila]
MRLDRTKLLNHINDSDIQSQLTKIIDKAEQCLRTHQPNATDFYEPHIIAKVSGILIQVPDLHFTIAGGYSEAERRRIVVYPDYMEYDNELEHISVLQINSLKPISHPQVLGTLTGLGIKREKIGDIITTDKYCQVIMDKTVAEFARYNIETIGRVKVTIDETGRDKISLPECQLKEITTTVASMRLDGIVAAGFNIPRQVATNLIKADKVKCNWEIAKSPAVQIEVNDLISCRKHGRIKVVEIIGTTKKDRIKIKINKLQ